MYSDKTTTIMSAKFLVDKLNISGAEVWPIIEGGKGTRVTNWQTSGAFAASDAVGTVSGAFPLLLDSNGENVPLVLKGQTRVDRNNEVIAYTIQAIVSQVKKAWERSGGRGRIHLNMLWETSKTPYILEQTLPQVKGFLHGVTCGAGLPYRLAEITSQNQIYYYPIVSSMRAFRILWKRAYSKFSQFLGAVVYEDPWRAGGHNGISGAENPDQPEKQEDRMQEIRSFMNEVGLSEVPIVLAGGVWSLSEWKHVINNPAIGPIAFQFGTRPLLTKESPITRSWREKLMKIQKGDVWLQTFSPTGFHSSAYANNFIRGLAARSSRQLAFSDEETEEFNASISQGPRGRQIFLKPEDFSKANAWILNGYSEIMRTPSKTIIFVSPEEGAKIVNDRVACKGCLSQCRFSNWKESDNHTTGIMPDPRSFCIFNALMDATNESIDIDDALMFSGTNGYRFLEDSMYKNEYIPTISELVTAILEGR